MSLLTLASAKSVLRGYEYFEDKNILSSEKISDTEIKGRVRGSYNKSYQVFIDTQHPRKSKCNCPHADGKRIICKHMTALFFNTFPEEAQTYYKKVIKYELEEEERQEELEKKLINYVSRLKKSELQDLLLNILSEGPEWQYERFIHMYLE